MSRRKEVNDPLEAFLILQLLICLVFMGYPLFAVFFLESHAVPRIFIIIMSGIIFLSELMFQVGAATYHIPPKES